MTRIRPQLRGVVSLAAIAPVLASLTLVGAVTKLGPSIAGCAEASTMHHAALLVEHSDGSGHGGGPVIRVCVPFSEESISGETLLMRSNVHYATGDSGQAVCQIENEPAQFQPQCLSAGNPYWAMFVSRGGGSWTYSSLGFTSQTFRDGDSEGFRYEGQNDATVPPSSNGVCPLAPTSAPVPPTSTPVPRATGGATSAQPSAATTPVRSPLTSPTAAADLRSPTASTSATAHPAASVVGSNRPTPLRTVSSGAWVAAGLGSLLVLGVVVQLARSRRRSTQGPPP